MVSTWMYEFWCPAVNTFIEIHQREEMLEEIGGSLTIVTDNDQLIRRNEVSLRLSSLIRA
jgi:hypothetical protein